MPYWHVDWQKGTLPMPPLRERVEPVHHRVITKRIAMQRYSRSVLKS
jgi:hypothetical protein